MGLPGSSGDEAHARRACALDGSRRQIVAPFLHATLIRTREVIVGTRDPRVDAYIERAAPFAQPVLRHLREVVHAACPDVTETLKWSMPSFMYEGILCGMAAFKAHCT